MAARTITHEGVTLTIDQWAARTQQSPQLLRYRLKAGWPVADALTQPRGARGVPAYRDVVLAERHRQDRIRAAAARTLHRDFEKLVRDMDRALNAFKYRLAAFADTDPGVSNDFAETVADRAPPVAQDRV
ncbi:hypothetical protein [Bradyrhizobium sp. SZCCHNR2032]|uniref:hypothetical protein n=1 Tax=Bradyrhizobium sp. SZCCHNR2032 TaxID=3057384 RepID=UPI002915F91E|nr:hypothetical protein [Bradyrhizobium sp. SZCCHNR2032]